MLEEIISQMIEARVKPLQDEIERLKSELQPQPTYDVKIAWAMKFLNRSKADILRRIERKDKQGRTIQKGLIKKAYQMGQPYYFNVKELEFIKKHPHLWNQPHLW